MPERNWLKNVSLLNELVREEFSFLRLYMEEVHYDEGVTVFEEDQEGGNLYFVKEGNLRIFRKGKESGEHELGTLGEGGVFGAVTFIDRGLHTASITVTSEAVVGVLTHKKFKMMAKRHPVLALKITKGLLLELQRILRKMNVKYVSMMDFIKHLGK